MTALATARYSVICVAPTPCLHISPRFYCPWASPWSAAKRYNQAGSAWSYGTPVPCSYITPRFTLRVPLVGGEAAPPGHLGVVLRPRDPGTILAHHSEADLRLGIPLVVGTTGLPR